MRSAAEIIEEHKIGIIEVWVQKVREELPAASRTKDPVLRDHVPLLLDDIIKIMKRFEEMEITSEISSYDGMLDHSIGHGRHRASSAGYDVAQVLKEYIILHKILTKKLRSEEIYSTDVADLLKSIIENSMLYAVVAFNNSLQEMRQKLIAVLAHDIRNPISAAYLSLDMMSKEDDPGHFEKVRDMSKDSMLRSLDLIENLLESVTVEAGEGLMLHFSERDLLEYVKSVYQEASEIYSNEVIFKCSAEEIKGVFDSAMVRRVLENIVSNAVKYGERGAPVTISVDDSTEKVVIHVHNRGNPIPKENQKEIFRFMNTSKGSSPGKLKSWGMGLSMVHAVAEAHGGSLELNSSEENGTTFSLLLNKYANEPGKVETALNFSNGSKDTSPEM